MSGSLLRLLALECCIQFRVEAVDLRLYCMS
jgi:hypothetical protein